MFFFPKLIVSVAFFANLKWHENSVDGTLPTRSINFCVRLAFRANEKTKYRNKCLGYVQVLMGPKGQKYVEVGSQS